MPKVQSDPKYKREIEMNEKQVNLIRKYIINSFQRKPISMSSLIERDLKTYFDQDNRNGKCIFNDIQKLLEGIEG